MYIKCTFFILLTSLVCVSAAGSEKWGNEDKFEEECLKSHNSYRKLHEAPDLKLDKNVTETALMRAKQLLTQYGHEGHVEGTGENLYRLYGMEELPSDCGNATGEWYNEIVDYDFEKGDKKDGSQGMTGHFTQVVWKEATSVGCAWSRKEGEQVVKGVMAYPNGTSEEVTQKATLNYIFIACVYQPQGNIVNHFKENVLPKAGQNAAEPTATVSTTSASATTALFKNPFELQFENSMKDNPFDSKWTLPPFNGKWPSASITTPPPDTTSLIPPQSQSGNEDKFQEECLQSHNTYRQMHAVNALKVDKKLTETALMRAKQLLTQYGHEGHVEGTGENLYRLYGTEELPSNCGNATGEWYNEIVDYDFEKGDKKDGSQGMTGHFTQVVWKEATSVGCAWSRKEGEQVVKGIMAYPNGTSEEVTQNAKVNYIFIACVYSPQGNTIDHFKENVLPKSGQNVVEATTASSSATTRAFSMGGKPFSSQKMELL